MKVPSIPKTQPNTCLQNQTLSCKNKNNTNSIEQKTYSSSPTFTGNKSWIDKVDEALTKIAEKIKKEIKEWEQTPFDVNDPDSPAAYRARHSDE